MLDWTVCYVCCDNKLGQGWTRLQKLMYKWWWMYCHLISMNNQRGSAELDASSQRCHSVVTEMYLIPIQARKYSLLSLKWQVLKGFSKFSFSTLNESHHLVVKCSYEGVCVNLDALKAKSAICSFQLVVQLSKKSSWPSWWWHIFIYTLLIKDVRMRGFGGKTSHEFDILQKLYYVRKRVFLHTFAC